MIEFSSSYLSSDKAPISSQETLGTTENPSLLAVGYTNFKAISKSTFSI